MAALTVPAYTPISAYTPSLGPEAVGVRTALAACAGVTYDAQLLQVDRSGTQLADLTPYLTKTQASITHDSTAVSLGVLSMSLGIEMAWGKDIVAPSIFMRSPQYQGGTWQRFPLGHYVVTSPDLDLSPGATHAVNAYEKAYLLQGDVGDSYLAAMSTTYASNVLAVLIAAGYIPIGTTSLTGYVAFSGAWAAKTLPADRNFPLSDTGTVYTFLDIINALLAESGCRPLYCDQNGLFVIETLPVPATQPQRWVFAKTDTAYGKASAASIVKNTSCSIKRDVWNVPNQWVFVQQGLSFQPTGTDGSNGRYVVNNTTQGPANQTAQGRIVNSTQFLNASGQTDLVAQGDAIVTALLSKSETIGLLTASWPCAWHYDVFQYTDDNLPDTNVRKVQAQKWTMPLNGDDMTWDTNVVAPL